MSCDPVQPVPEVLGAPRLVPPPPGDTSLVTRPGTRPTWTTRRECDARTAARRGLAEYLSQVSVEVGGYRQRLRRVHYEHADHEEKAEFPAGYVESTSDDPLDAASMTPVVDPAVRTVDGVFLVRYAELTLSLVLRVYCSSPEERSAMALLLEDALHPVDWMYGFVLELPHYHGARATFEPVSSGVLDTEDAASRRWREGRVTLQAQVPVLRPRRLPLLDPRVVVEVGQDT